jgi:regulatory subunit for Cdc7p protein kinase
VLQREEKFFSNAVTHVVTTRAIPTEQSHTSGPSVASAVPQQQNSQPRTINPSLLERSTESTSVQTDLLSAKGRFTFEASLNKRLVPHAHEGEIKRTQARNADVLYRARELGMKIWTLEKLQRMMNTMFDTDSGYHGGHGYTTSNNTAGGAALPRTNREADLSQLLRNERINGPSDRDPTVATKEMVMFKGPFIYIHDIDEKQRPIMVREYSKVAHKEDGDWPQFRSVANGKCPFVEDVDHSKREAEKEREMLRLQRQQEKEKSMIPRARPSTAAPASRMQPPTVSAAKRPLAELDDGSNRNVTVLTKQANPFDTSSRTRVSAEPSSKDPQNAFISRAGAGPGRLFGGEPGASGVQPSNVTSAIRSQMISSTAAQPGAKAGTSKEVHGLQRKVLEKTSGGPASYGGVASSHRTADINHATKEDMAARQAKRKEKLDLIEEDVDPSEREDQARKAENARKARAVQQRKLEKRDPKPGYCENCQDKFDDFDEVRPPL